MLGLFCVVVATVLFVGSHLLLAGKALRGRLVQYLGERGFFLSYSLLAVVLYSVWISVFAPNRFSGPPGLAFTDVTVLRWPLMAIIVVGLTIAGAGLVAYPRLPTALFDQAIRQPRGIERVSRHPFFSGIALFAIAHMFLVTHLTSVVFFGGLALLAIAGARLQDQKLAERRGEPFEAYLAQTSFWPFASGRRGSSSIVWSGLPWVVIGVAFLGALWLRFVHNALFAHGGAWIIAAIVGGASVASLNAWRRARRLQLRAGTAGNA